MTSSSVVQSVISDRPSAAPAVAPGRGSLHVVRSGSRSVVTGAFATSPLRLLTPANHGHAAWIYTSTYGGGLVDGDRMAIDVDVGRGATAFLSTQASTKVYRSPHGTSADLNCRVAAGGLAIVAPDPVVCFAGAGYRQHQRFDVADDGALVAIDCIVSGRRAAGERWAFVDYRSRLEVTVGERLIVHDSMALRAADGGLARRLGRFNALAVIVIAGTALRTEARRLIAESSRQAVARRADQIMTVMPIGDDGCIVRIAGVSSEHVGRKMRETVQFVPQRLGDDPWARKW